MLHSIFLSTVNPITLFFGDYIRHLREEKELPIRKLAAYLDIDQSTLSKIERSERLPKLELIHQLATFFKIDEKEFKIRYLSIKVISPILYEENAETILQAAEEKLKYFKSTNSKQGKLFE